jgi:hypothetical protein
MARAGLLLGAIGIIESLSRSYFCMLDLSA